MTNLMFTGLSMERYPFSAKNQTLFKILHSTVVYSPTIDVRINHQLLFIIRNSTMFTGLLFLFDISSLFRMKRFKKLYP